VIRDSVPGKVRRRIRRRIRRRDGQMVAEKDWDKLVGTAENARRTFENVL